MKVMIICYAKNHLRRHQLSTHSRTYEISCLKCEKKFTRADNMRRNKKTCCACGQCSKSFETIKELNDHNCSNLSDRKVTCRTEKKYLQTKQHPVRKKAPRQQVVVPKRQTKRNF